MCGANPLLWRPHAVHRNRLKTGRPLHECELHFAGWTVALFSDNQLGLALEFGLIRLVDFLAENESHNVCILLDRSRFAKVGELRTVIAGPLPERGLAARKLKYRHFEFLGQRLQSSRDG